jgi:hypothetical protein
LVDKNVVNYDNDYKDCFKNENLQTGLAVFTLAPWTDIITMNVFCIIRSVQASKTTVSVVCIFADASALLPL